MKTKAQIQNGLNTLLNKKALAKSDYSSNPNYKKRLEIRKDVLKYGAYIECLRRALQAKNAQQIIDRLASDVDRRRQMKIRYADVETGVRKQILKSRIFELDTEIECLKWIVE